MIDLYTTLRHSCFDMTRAQRIRYLPADAHQHDLLRAMGPFEADHQRRSPSLCTLHHRGKAYAHVPQMKNATELSIVRAVTLCSSEQPDHA